MIVPGRDRRERHGRGHRRPRRRRCPPRCRPPPPLPALAPPEPPRPPRAGCATSAAGAAAPARTGCSTLAAAARGAAAAAVPAVPAGARTAAAAPDASAARGRPPALPVVPAASRRAGGAAGAGGSCSCRRCRWCRRSPLVPAVPLGLHESLPQPAAEARNANTSQRRADERSGTRNMGGLLAATVLPVPVATSPFQTRARGCRASRRSRARQIALRVYQLPLAGAAGAPAAASSRAWSGGPPGAAERQRRLRPWCGSRSSRTRRALLGSTRACRAAPPSSASPAVPMNFAASGFFCCSAMKPARSVGCGQLGQLGVRHLELVLDAPSCRGRSGRSSSRSLLVEGANSFFIVGSTVVFMYFFLAFTSIFAQSIFFPAATASGDGAAGASAFAASAWGGHRRRRRRRRTRAGRRARGCW